MLYIVVIMTNGSTENGFGPPHHPWTTQSILTRGSEGSYGGVTTTEKEIRYKIHTVVA